MIWDIRCVCDKTKTEWELTINPDRWKLSDEGWVNSMAIRHTGVPGWQQCRRTQWQCNSSLHKRLAP